MIQQASLSLAGLVEALLNGSRWSFWPLVFHACFENEGRLNWWRLLVGVYGVGLANRTSLQQHQIMG